MSNTPTNPDPKVMLTIVTDNDTFSAEFALQSTTIAQLKHALELQTGIAAHRQMLTSNGTRLVTPDQSLASAGIVAEDLVMLDEDDEAESSAAPTAPTAHPAAAATAGTGAAGAEPPVDQDAILNGLRQQLLSNPHAMAQLRQSHPEAAAAVEQGDTQGLRRLIETQRSIASAQEAEQQSFAQLANADPFDPDAQARIEEAIRQERVLENLEHAMEYSPESFGRVTMLYVDTWVEGTPVKAFVDSGAQATIMSPLCAERCGIMRLIDRRFEGVARGVGEAKILGRVHSAQIRLGPNLFLPCSFTIMDNKNVDLLFGLDMLRRFQACIDLRKNCLVVGQEEIRFLSEHELPTQARDEATGINPSDPNSLTSRTTGSSGPTPATQDPSGPSGGESAFPGSGQTLGSTPPVTAPSTAQPTPSSSASAPAVSTAAAPAARSGPQFSSQDISTLKDLGASDAQAVQLLQAAGGNVEVAASLLFQM